MQIPLPLKDAAPLELAEGATADQIANAIGAHPAVYDGAVELGSKSHWTAYVADDMDTHTALRIARAYAEEGRGNAEALICDMGLRQDQTAYYEHVMEKDVRRFFEPLVEAVLAAAPNDDIDPDDVVDKLVERMEEAIGDGMIAGDDSAVIDVIPERLRVEVAFVMGAGKNEIDDLQTIHLDNVSMAETVVPNANFLRFLKLVNVSVGEFTNMVRAEHDVDLLDLQIPEDASDYVRERLAAHSLQWRAVLQVENRTGSDEVGKLPLRGKHAIDEWNERVDLIRTLKDYSRPAALGAQDVMNVVDNATYGGVATYVARLPLKRFVEGAYTAPFVATGGMVGIHEFRNGSGYVESPAAPVLIDPQNGGFYVHRTRQPAIDDVYGIVDRALDIKTADPHRTRWVQSRDGAWVLDGFAFADDDAGYAVVTTGEEVDGRREFWLQTRSWSNDTPSGPQTNAEVYLSLDDARCAGEAILKAGPEVGAAPAP